MVGARGDRGWAGLCISMLRLCVFPTRNGSISRAVRAVCRGMPTSLNTPYRPPQDGKVNKPSPQRETIITENVSDNTTSTSTLLLPRTSRIHFDSPLDSGPTRVPTSVLSHDMLLQEVGCGEHLAAGEARLQFAAIRAGTQSRACARRRR